MPYEEAWQHFLYHLETVWHILFQTHPMVSGQPILPSGYPDPYGVP